MCVQGCFSFSLYSNPGSKDALGQNVIIDSWQLMNRPSVADDEPGFAARVGGGQYLYLHIPVPSLVFRSSRAKKMSFVTVALQQLSSQAGWFDGLV